MNCKYVSNIDDPVAPDEGRSFPSKPFGVPVSCRTRVIVVFGWLKPIIESYRPLILLLLSPLPMVKSSGSSISSILLSVSFGPRNSNLMSLRRVPLVGDARALSSAGEILTPALASKRDASSGSNGLGIGSTGKSFVEIPRC